MTQAPGLVLGLSFAGDAVTVVLLPVCLLGWLAVLPAVPFDRRFHIFAVLAAIGSLGAVAAADLLTYYVFFGIATLASYGLIVADESQTTRWVGRLYLALALIGELMLLAALLMLLSGQETMASGWLLVFGLGAKLGLPPLHVVLPPSYMRAPTAGAAAFAGPVLVAAMAGLVRFAPLLGGALSEMSGGLIVLGLFTAFLGVGLGVAQKNARALLGYSSASQMGLLVAFIGIGAGLDDRTTAFTAALVLAAHHGLVKPALVLGTALPRGRGVLLALLLLSLAIAGLSLTGGAIAKLWAEEAGRELAEPWHGIVARLLPATSVASTLVMARFMWLARRVPRRQEGSVTVFGLFSVAALGAPWVLASWHPHPQELVLAPGHLWQTLWPVALGVLLAAWASLLPKGLLPHIPPGDIAVILRRPAFRLARWIARPPTPWPPLPLGWTDRAAKRLRLAERYARSFVGIGFAYFLVLSLFALLALS